MAYTDTKSEEVKKIQIDNNIISLYNCILKNNIEYSGILLEKGADPNTRYNAKAILLHHACKYAKIEMVSLLLKYGANVNGRDNKKRIPFSAVSNDERIIEITKILIDNGSRVNSKDDYLVSPVHISVRSPGNTSYLLTHRAKINIKDKYNTPLNNTVSAKNNKIAELLIYVTDLNFAGYHNETSLIRAVKNNNFEIAKILLQRKVNINLTDYMGYTALHFAVEHGIKMTKLLLDNDADVNIKSLMHSYPIDRSIRLKISSVVKFLLSNRQNILDVDSSDGVSVLHLAVHNNIPSIISLLIESGFPINVLDKYGHTALYYAVSYNNFKLAKLLIDKGADVNLGEGRYKTPISTTISDNRLKIAKLLLENGANPNVIGYNSNDTILCDAVCFNKVEMLKLLLEYGADPNIGSTNHMPLSYAVKSNKTDTAKILLDYGANPNIVTIMYEPILYSLVRDSRLDMVSLLLQYDIDIEIRNNNGYTALHVACYRGNVPITKLLIDNNACINAKNHLGLTPLFIAVYNKKVNCCITLLKNGAVTCDNPNHDVNCSLGTSIKNDEEIAKLLIQHTKTPICSKCISDIRKCHNVSLFIYALMNEVITYSIEEHLVKPFIENPDRYDTNDNKSLIVMILYVAISKKYRIYLKSINKTVDDIPMRYIKFNYRYEVYAKSEYARIPIKDLSKLCDEEIDRMTKIKIGNYTVFEVYATCSVSTRMLSRFSINIDNICSELPIYGSSMRGILEDALAYKSYALEYLDKLNNAFINYSPWNILPEELKHRIIEYIDVNEI